MNRDPATNRDLHGSVPERWQSDCRRLVDHGLDEGVSGEEVARLPHPEGVDDFVPKPNHTAFLQTTLWPGRA